MHCSELLLRILNSLSPVATISCTAMYHVDRMESAIVLELIFLQILSKLVSVFVLLCIRIGGVGADFSSSW